MRFFKRKWIGRARYHDEWQTALKQYGEYLARIKPLLPETAQLFVERARMHDEVIDQASQPSSNELVLETAWYQLVFTGVKEFSTTGRLPGDVWLYEEIELPTDRRSCFRLNVLLEENDVRVVAENVQGESRGRD